jgi:hypothetical protein
MHTDQKRDPTFMKIFNIAFDKTKWDLYVYQPIPYENEADALGKLLVIQVKKVVWDDIVASLPEEERVRKLATKIAEKSINSIVDTMTSTAWGALDKQVRIDHIGETIIAHFS